MSTNRRIKDDLELEEELESLRAFRKERGIPGPFLDEKPVADYLNKPVNTLQVGRVGRGDFANLEFYKFGASVKYHERHVARHAARSRRRVALPAAE